MKFTAEREPLVAAVKRAAGVVESRNTVAILGCLLMQASDTGLSVFATNLDSWVTAKCAAATADAGVAVVNAAQLVAWLNATPKGKLIKCIVGDRAVFTAGRMTASFEVLDRLDFPIPISNACPNEVIGGIKAMATCLPYVSSEEARYYLNGVAVSQGHVVATNSHMVCAVDVSAPDDWAAIIPTPAVRQIIQSSPAARLWIGENQWSCEDEGVTMGGKLIDGTFPDWTRAMPRDLGAVAEFDADDMMLAANAVVMASNERSRAVAMVAANGNITLSCRGEAMTATAVVPHDGGAFEFGINQKYLSIAAGTFSGNVVRWAQDSGLVVMTCAAMPEMRVAIMGMRV